MAERDHLLLYVDDDWSNRIVFEQSFTQRFRVRTAPSAQDALELLKSEPVAVLVTDQRMPDMSGNDLLVRAKTLCPEAVRVVITAYSDLDPILRAVNDGLVARYIIKPWDRDELERILAWAIEAHVLGREDSALQLRLMETERLVTLGSIGAAVLHDLNQPISYVSENARRLADLAASAPALTELARAHSESLSPVDARNLADLAAELGDIARDVLEGCTQMSETTAGIRRLLKPTAGDAQRRCDPHPIIQYALKVCGEIAVRARGRLRYEGPPALPQVRIGAPELTQVLVNLVANAAQALGRRQRPGGRVVVSAAEQGPRLQVRVTDDGPGMPPEVLAKVGTPFFTTRPDGTGLGVAQCRRLIERERGELKIESAEGAGTTVTLLLDRA
jgi:signal transduction histidine kinase